ncbi:MAG: NAD(P)-dependent oxidoreductase [Anaerolineae bacterium]
MSGYPITLVDLVHARVVVGGGSEVAARKVAALREAGARLVVISPVLCDALRRRAAAGESARETGITAHIVPYGTREFKKERVRHFEEDEA